VSATGPTLVLIHGAGLTAAVWDEVRANLAHPSVAVDVPGRRDRHADITRVTIDEVADSVVADVDAVTGGPVVMVGHSTGGIVVPAVAARLGARVGHLVFVAGLCARDGERVVDTVIPGQSARVLEQLAAIRREHRGAMLAPEPPGSAPTVTVAEAGSIESYNFMTQTMSWKGVPPAAGRTWVRCLRDKIQPRDLQAKLAANCGASEVVDIESGHTPQRAAPVELAAVLDRIATRVAAG
jgi:pimeloyl-ACP methyl ester carboxylesterase